MKASIMGMPVRIDDQLYEQAKAHAHAERRTIAGQSSNSTGKTPPFLIKILVANPTQIPHSFTPVRAAKTAGQRGAITAVMGGALMPVIDSSRAFSVYCTHTCALFRDALWVTVYVYWSSAHSYKF
jgi:hypothetical protein